MSTEDNYSDHYKSKLTVTWQDYARADMFLPKGACKRWDYFVQHLLGETPPQGYIIKNC